MITEIDRPDTDRADTDRAEVGRTSSFATVPSVRVLNMIALVTAVLWLLGSVGAVTSLADASNDSPALWDYVVAATEAGEYLIVTVIAWSSAAVLDSLNRLAR